MSTSPASGELRVLLVEDNPADARLVRELVREDSGDALTFIDAGSLRAALERLATERFDAVLLDLSLPDATGSPCVHAIRASSPETPLLILSGQSDESVAMEAVQDGADDYLVKGQISGASLVRAIRYSIRRHERTLRLANYDALTELPNRLLFRDRLHHALIGSRRYGTTLGVLFFDLDGFKAVNDAHGHDAGDEVLRTVATAVRGVLRESDTFARFGGDEFAVLLPAITVPDDAAVVSRKILDLISQPIRITAAEVRVGASIGVTFAPLDGDDAETLLKYADAAMYRAKRAGKRRFEFHRPLAHTSGLDSDARLLP